MKTKKVFLWTIVVLFAVGAVCLFLLWRYIYTPVSIGKMERFYKKHCVEMEQLAAYANRAVDDGAYLWLHLFPNGDEGLYIRAQGAADTLRLGVHVLDSDSLLQAVGLTTAEHDAICQRLRAIGCIGISVSPDRRQTQIHYMYGGPFDEYFFGYSLYNGPMTAEERNGNLQNDYHVPYNDSVVFLMGYLNKDSKEEYLQKHNYK
jgi:hypothetical protein